MQTDTLAEESLKSLPAGPCPLAPLPGVAAVAQPAERRPGKAEVPGSNPGGGSTAGLTPISPNPQYVRDSTGMGMRRQL